MKILFLSRFQNIVERGAENFVTELSQRLSKNNQVEIFYGEKADSLTAVYKFSPDIVIPVNGRMQSLKVSLGRSIKKYKVLISGHSGKGWDDIWNIVMARPDVFVALTNIMAKWAKRFALGIKVVTIPDGVDLKKFNPNGEKLEFGLPRPVILSVGALTWYKHHERAIEAISKLDKGSLLIVGEGEGKEELEKYGYKKLGQRFKIIKAEFNQMPKIYQAADVFTLPSWDREAFGMVYIEAMACNLPVVAPDDQTRREIIGEGGIFVDVEDSHKYAQAITAALAKDWGQKPRLQAENFSWEEISKKYEEIMQNILK